MGESLESVGNEELENRIVDLAARIAAATCRWLELVAEFDRRKAHEEWGFVCCASWLAWRCSIAPRSAREHLWVARCLGELPATRSAFAAGELSYSKVRCLTRVATPEIEEELVELARHATAAQLERVARGFGRAMNAADAENAHERRYLSYEWERDGSLSIRGSLCAEDGALLLRALETGREALRDLDSIDGGSAEPLPDRLAEMRMREPINADALVLMAETLLAGEPKGRAAAERTQLVVHVDAALLQEDTELQAEGADPKANGAARGPRRCELEDGAPISPETARRLSCDASRVTLVEDEQGPVSVGRRARTVPPATRRALRARDGGCRFPGCTHSRWTDGHHIVHWADGGETSLENTVQLCRRHHRLVHEGDFKVNRGEDGEVRFWTPDGTQLEHAPALRDHSSTTAPRSRSGRPSRDRGATDHGGRRRIAPLQPAEGVPVPLSAGDSMDLDLTVASLASRTANPTRAP